MKRPRGDTHTIEVPRGTRLKRIVRLPTGWLCWTATNDYIYGSYLLLSDDGGVLNVTVRADEGDDTFVVRPPDNVC